MTTGERDDFTDADCADYLEHQASIAGPFVSARLRKIAARLRERHHHEAKITQAWCVAGCGRASMMPESEYCPACASELKDDHSPAALAADEVHDDSEIVGHKTLSNPDGSLRHEPLTRFGADELMQRADEAKAKRAEAMPTDADAACAMWDAWYRLKELGWQEARYARDGTRAQVVEAGSAGIHTASKDRGCWWIEWHGDLWPSTPTLCKPLTQGIVGKSTPDVSP